MVSLRYVSDLSKDNKDAVWSSWFSALGQTCPWTPSPHSFLPGDIT